MTTAPRTDPMVGWCRCGDAGTLLVDDGPLRSVAAAEGGFDSFRCADPSKLAALPSVLCPDVENVSAEPFCPRGN